MLTTSPPSPYAAWSDTLRDNGYHVMPCMPGAKVPGSWSGSHWQPLSQWSRYCDQMPSPFLHGRWQDWPGAGICLAHGAVVGLDIDTDRKDVEQAALTAIPPSTVRRVGQKGWMGYYRAPSGEMPHTARVRWYDPDGKVCVELLLHGTQSVLPPTIHPKTGQPYRWTTAETLESLPADELVELPSDAVERLDAAFTAVGLTRQAPRRIEAADYVRSAPADHDLEKPFGRSLNDRAMEPDAIDRWWPALQLPKSRQRGRSGYWEAVPFWRGSGSGRAVQDRNPNLRCTPGGIVDFGADRKYTPADVVMAARDCSFMAASEWLTPFIRAEDVEDLTGIAAPVASPPTAEAAPQPGAGVLPAAAEMDLGRWAAMPVFGGRRSTGALRPVAMPSEAEFHAMLPKEPPPFPIGDLAACEGLLGEVAAHIEAAAPVQTEAGGLAVALPLLGAAFGRAYAGPTGLRTNVYSVALAGSGMGKTSVVNPAKELMQLSQLGHVIGSDRIASGSGLLKLLMSEPRRICFLDEFGHMLQQIGSAGAGIHAKAILTEFTALYSAANTLFTGTAYATQEPSPIDCPHLCLFGMATPEQFWRAFGSSSLEDGSIARYLVFPLGQTAPKEMDGSAAQAVADQIKAVQDVIAKRVRGNLGNVEITVAPFDDYGEKAWTALKHKETAFAEFADRAAVRGAPAILRRVTENALKIALISAVGRNPSSPVIDGRDMDIGHALAWWSANSMISNIASHIADNQIERDVNDVERFILEAGQGGRPWRDVQRRFRRIRTRDLKEIVEGLEREGSIREETTPTPLGGPPTKTYFAVR